METHHVSRRRAAHSYFYVQSKRNLINPFIFKRKPTSQFSYVKPYVFLKCLMCRKKTLCFS